MDDTDVQKNYKHKYCEICDKEFKDYYQHKRIKHSEKEKAFELCFDCGKTFQKNYIKRHKCSKVILIAKQNWGVYCKECETFHMTMKHNSPDYLDTFE